MKRTVGVAVLCVALSSVAVRAATADLVPGPDVWRAAARSGVPVELRVHGRALRLAMRQTHAFADTDVIGLDGAHHDLGDVLVLAGSVAGATRQWARVVVTDEMVTGLIHADGGDITLAPARDGSVRVVDARDIAGALQGRSSIIEPGDAEAAESCDSLEWTPEVAAPTEFVSGSALRTFDVAFAVDETFVKQHPNDWAALVTSFVNTIDGLYRDSFDLTIRIVHIVAIPDAVVSATTTDGLLVQLQDYYAATYPAVVRDNAHLFTGKDLTNAAGQVNCVGSAGRTSVSYSVGTTVGGPYTFFGALVLLPDVATKVGAHEMAHTLSDHHHYANCAEAAPNINPVHTTDVCTVMINDWGLINMTFSTVDKLMVRGWIAKYNI